MGLASALSTALTGLTAAETTIDLIGNNLANSNTVGFKSSEVNFSTQFLQTLGLGSAPSEQSGGTNPKQIGLGTMVASITPNFNQGTIEISSNPLDLAIQDDGFFTVQGGQGETLYTRNGIFKTNGEHEVVTITGHRLLGYGIDDDYQIQRTTLEPLKIPLGSKAVAAATQNVYLEGTLTPNGAVADTSSLIRTGILGDAKYPAPEPDPAAPPVARQATAPMAPEVVPYDATPTGTPGAMVQGTYEYRLVYATGVFDPTSSVSTESALSNLRSVTLDAPSENAVFMTALPDAPNPPFTHLRIYRRELGGEDPNNFHYLDELEYGVDDFSQYIDRAAPLVAPTPNTRLNETELTGNYNYAVVYRNGDRTSRPYFFENTINVSNGRIYLKDLPTLPLEEREGWEDMLVYRNLRDSSEEYHLVTTMDISDPNGEHIDNVSDAELATREELNWNGPTITDNTYLVDVLRRDGKRYENVFKEGTLEFTGRKGGRALQTKSFEITATTTVRDLIDFGEQAMGIQRVDGADTELPGQPGGGVDSDGRIFLRGNTGVDNALDIGLSGMVLRTSSGTETVNMPWGVAQAALGQSAVTDFIAYDSLGTPVRVRVTAVLEQRTDTMTTYRWFADSADNLPATGATVAVGTGLISFDGEGNYVDNTGSTISIERRGTPAASPLEFDLDFSQLSGLATEKPSLAVTRQDGSAPGVLTSFLISESGIIRGVFSNGVARDLGQIRLSRFANPAGLEQRGQNLYAEGVDSGLPVQASPGEQGMGTIIAGARELSNTDIGKDLISLILASTMYRGNTRVITTSQQMLEELLTMRR